MTLIQVRVSEDWPSLAVGDLVYYGMSGPDQQCTIQSIRPNPNYQSGAEVYVSVRVGPIDPWYLWRDIPFLQ